MYMVKDTFDPNILISNVFQPSDEECDNMLKEACDAVDAGEQGPLVAQKH